MPQTSTENLRYTQAILRADGYDEEDIVYNLDAIAFDYLKDRDWHETRGGFLVPPKNPSEDEWEVATYLVQEWDFGISEVA